ncbi:MAG: hypothetical protein U0521_26920 [Anaerolineae bacterium]
MRIHYRYTYGLLISGKNEEALAAAADTITANPFSSDAWAIQALALERNQRCRSRRQRAAGAGA